MLGRSVKRLALAAGFEYILAMADPIQQKQREKKRAEALRKNLQRRKARQAEKPEQKQKSDPETHGNH